MYLETRWASSEEQHWNNSLQISTVVLRSLQSLWFLEASTYNHCQSQLRNMFLSLLQVATFWRRCWCYHYTEIKKWRSILFIYMQDVRTPPTCSVCLIPGPLLPVLQPDSVYWQFAGTEPQGNPKIILCMSGEGSVVLGCLRLTCKGQRQEMLLFPAIYLLRHRHSHANLLLSCPIHFSVTRYLCPDLVIFPWKPNWLLSDSVYLKSSQGTRLALC